MTPTFICKKKKKKKKEADSHIITGARERLPVQDTRARFFCLALDISMRVLN
jgi:hypothetical protein